MRINLILLVVAVSITAILLCTSFHEVRGSPSPKKRKGSSENKGSSGSTSHGSSPTGTRPSTSGSGSKSTSSSGGRKWFGGGGYKPSKSGISKKSFSKGTGKKFKKALAFGAGVYIASKVLKKVGKAFKPRIFNFGGRDYDFDEWNGYSRIDGWVCRTDRDCQWIDQFLGCDDREFSINVINAPWPWKAELTGRCACENGFYFNRDIGSCVSYSTFATIAGWMIAVIVVVVLVGACVCCCCVCFIMKKLFKK